MLRRLLDRNPDIQRLVDDGYHVAVDGAYLLVKDVPYVTTDRVVAYGTLADELTSDTDSKPERHTVWFTGSDPCDHNGQVIGALKRANRKALTRTLNAQHQFSRKPTTGPTNYGDHYTKMTAYVTMLESHAQRIDPTVTARAFHPLADDDDESPFRYLDTASTRAGIVAATGKLRLDRLAIIGLGGTGAYILDQLAKLPIHEIHLFDGDTFDQHNAFRAPGAATFEELIERLPKVDYFQRRYDPMHGGIVAHPERIDHDNMATLTTMNFAFLAFDGGPEKEAVIELLVANEVPFIDVGMGLVEGDGRVSGQLRVSSITTDNRDRATDRHFIPCTPPEDNEYDFNVQVADMNALNAILAVIRFKKVLGFYEDVDNSQQALYTIFDNYIANEETE